MGTNFHEWGGGAGMGGMRGRWRGGLFAEGVPGSVSPATTEVAGGLASRLEGG